MSGDSKPERPSVSARPSARARSSNSTSRKRPASGPSRSRAPLVRALLTFGILALALYFAISTPARLGLDLRGGTQIVLETQD